MSIDFKKLAEPFSAADIEWRLQECGKKGDRIWAMCLAYITNRAIMQRLDDVCGPDMWKNEYQPGPQGGVVCGLSIRCGDEWVTKWDGADNTQVEATKGGLSDAMKRAGVQWGIGRYLYNLDVGFANVLKDGEKGEYRGKVKEGNIWFTWNPPKLPAWALPSGTQNEGPKKEAPPLPDAAQAPKPIEEPTKARVDLFQALATVYNGNTEEMADALRHYSSFTGKDQAEKFLTMANLEHPTANEKMHKWFSSTLSKLQKDSAK